MPFTPRKQSLSLTSAAVMGLGVLLLYRNTEARLLVTIPGWANHAATLVSIAGGVVIYVLMLLLLGGIKRSDLLLIPKVGPVVVRIAERFHLLRG